MLEVLAAVVGLFAVVTAGRDARSRRWRAVLWRLVAGLLVVGVLLVPLWRRVSLQSRLASAAGELIGERVDVDCVTLLGEFTNEHFAHAGWVNWDAAGKVEKRTVLSYDTCRHLRSFLADPGTTDLDALYAVHTLAHEARHMAGTTNEAETECEAHQRMAAMSRLLGADDRQARAATVAVWQETYPLMPDEYRSAECRDGGALDEGLADAPWDLADRADS